MKKLKLFFACLLMAVLSIGQVWGAVYFEDTFSDVGTGSSGSMLPRDGWSGSGTTAPQYNTGVRLGASSSGATLTKAAMSNIEGTKSLKVTIYVSRYNTNANTLTVTATNGTIASATLAENVSTGSELNAGTLTIKPSANAGVTSTTAAATWTDAYKTEFTITGASSSTTIAFASDKRLILGPVKIEDADGTPSPAKTLVSVAVSGTPTKTSYYAGDEFDPAGLTVMGTYSDESTAPITSGITWSYDPSQELALNQTSIGVIATVSEIASSKVNVSITVTEAPAAVNYEKVTAEPADWSGEYLLVYEADATNARVWKGADQANNYAEATISAGVIAAPEGAAVLTIAKVAESDPVVYTIMVGDKYIGQTSDANGIKIQASAIDNSISYNGTEAAIDIVASSAHLRYNSASSSYFRYYKSATYSSQKKIQLYKKVDGAVKPAAGLAFETSAYLVKANGSLATPTLSTADGFDGTVTYASSDADVVAVNTTTGALTIKAAGKAEITASSLETENFKAGSAKYTVYVAEQAGTAEDPLTEASAKALIDLGCEMEVHVHGTVLGSQDATKFTVTLAGGMQFYKLKDLGNVAFESAYIKNGDEVTAIGTLTKYNTTYELAEGCYLTAYTEYTEPLVDISNTKETAYTVAQALALATNPTSDLTKAVYIAGVVYDVKNFNSTNGTLDIYIKDDGEENKFEFYKCAGIYDESLTAFTAADDVQVGDEVIGYGVMKYYSGGSIWEFDNTATGDYLVELTRPEVAVESISLPATETVEVGSTVTLTATVLPENASNKALTWTVVSGSDKASVDENGVVTGVAEGTADIRATSQADNTQYAECTVTVVAADPTKHVVTFDAEEDKTIEDTELSLTKGDLTIAITSGDGRFNNETDYRVYKSAEFTVSCASGNITKIEFTCTSSYTTTGFDAVEGLNTTTGVWTGNAPSVAFTAGGKQVRIEELVITYKEDNRAASGLAWSTDAVELTVGDEFTAPTLSNPNNIDASAITIASNNPDLAVVNDGVVSLVENATGEATITATFAGNETYKPAIVSYTITVNAAAPTPLTDYYEKVTETAGIVEGTYLIVYEEGSLAFNGGLTTLDAESNTIAVEITNDNKIGVTEQTAAATFYIDPAAGTVKSASNYYIGVGSWSNGLKQTDKTDTYIHNVFEIDGDGNAQVGIYNADWNTTGGTMRLQYNKSAGQTRFRYFKNGGQQSIALYKLANEVIKPEAGLAWNPAEDIEITVGGAFSAPTLLNPNNIDAAEISIESSNTAVATVTEGVVELVENATGTTTITATFAGNASYKPATVSYKIKVNPANSIYVSPSLNVNFGSVAKDATVDDKVITVTLTGVPAASVALAGDGASAFTFTPDALTASGDITISASSATAGTFNATLTISDDEGVADSKVVNLSLTVNEPEIIDDLTGTWVLATAVPEIGEKFIVAGTYNSVTKTMGAQNTNNRAAVASTLAEGVLTPGEGTKVFTLVDAGEGKYAIQASNGKYLTASGTGTKNYLTEAANYEAVNAKWTISVDGEGAASAVASSSNRNDLQYNKSGDGLFSCYDGNQTAIQFFVQQSDTPEPPVVDYTEVRNGLTEGWYYTMCLDKAVTAVKAGSIWRVLSKAANDNDVILEEAELPLEAGRPYIFRAAANTLEVAYTGDAVLAPVTEGNNGLIGSFEQVQIANDPKYYIIHENALYYVNSDNVYVGAHRAYLDMTGVPAYSNEPQQGAPRRRVMMSVHAPTVATGIDAINASEKPMKLMINGQIYILRGEKMYDATGRLVK